jgi:hypothetical protein
MRWFLLLVAFSCFAVVFSAKTAGLIGLALVLGLICLFGSMFGFAAARIASTARPDAALLTDKDISALRASIRKPGAAPAPNMPSPNGG